MAGEYWTFHDFVNANGENEIALWLGRQPKAKKARVWAKLDNALDYLIGQEVHTDRRVIAKLDARRDRACADLYEIRIGMNGVEYRPLAYRGPKPKGQYTLLLGAKEKGGQFEPHNACQLAAGIIADIENQRGSTVEHQRFQEVSADSAGNGQQGISRRTRRGKHR